MAISAIKRRLDKLEKFKEQDTMSFLMATNGVLADGRKIEDVSGNYYIMNLVDDTITLSGNGVAYTMPVKDDKV